MTSFKSFKCPFCNNSFPLIDNFSYWEECVIFRPGENLGVAEKCDVVKIPMRALQMNSIVNKNFQETVWLYFHFCPNCNQTSLILKSIGGSLGNYAKYSYPEYAGNKYPDYVPLSVRNDYEEACNICMISPKASATLARRCLQGIIRDFWKITRGRLVDEINELESKIDSELWDAIDGVRKIGNIGAHMEKNINIIIDVDECEAEMLIKLIELIIKETYINRESRKSLLSEVANTATTKQGEKVK